MQNEGARMIKRDYKYLADDLPKSEISGGFAAFLVCVVFVLITIDWELTL
tara:strand:- start:160 stop:309 length:150 start_codon:yes stop_codon:yes gene_type:complete